MTERYLEVAIKAARTSGYILRDYFEKLHDFREKNLNIRDLVTEVDILSEKNIKNIIREEFPDHSIIAEESQVEENDPAMIWHVDPLDGTVNYSQGIPLCAISVALQEHRDIVAGVVFNPFTDELYFATKGRGAFLNGRQVHVSAKSQVKDGVYVAAFSSAPFKEKKKEYEIFGRVNDTTRGVLRLGSAALALAYLAAGRIDGFWSKNLPSWDIAAGIILVKEAGGRVSTTEDKEYVFESPALVASNSIIHAALLNKLAGL